jgi:uncharacterized ferritin-like protein (DUF455 family)
MPAYVEQLLAVIAAPDRAAKAALLAGLEPPEAGGWSVPELPPRPGRPAQWREATEPPRRRRTLAHAPTRLRFLLAIHHIELSAVDLAVAACLRAPDLPAKFHHDFLTIARDEARHAGLLEDLLATRGAAPGDEPIHHRLWEAALACRDLGEHLVAVPRVLEARGLDVSAELLPRLLAIDPQAHAVITIIYQDEIAHVAAGTRWHHAWCAARGLDPSAHFAQVAGERFPGQFPGPTPLDRPGRAAAGFSADDMAFLENGEGR